VTRHVDFAAEGRLPAAVVAISRGGGLFIGGGGHGKKRKESVGSGGEGAGRLTVPTRGGGAAPTGHLACTTLGTVVAIKAKLQRFGLCG
jgi:hypothetical protein